MIQEAIVSTLNKQGQLHLAPMGIHFIENDCIILPFKPSATLDNIVATRSAIINYCDDVRIFAGCLTGRRHWSTKPAEKIIGYVLNNALSHQEVTLIKIENHPLRPKLFCQIQHSVNHSPFRGFNRAQFAVIEAAILISRLNYLPFSEIEMQINYLRIMVEKTASAVEWEAWGWLMAVIHQYKQQENL
ncbi:MAG: hypothetical protein RL637_554 [Pseudomonadota bacterium]|jgi:hypothetical protein